MKSSISEDDRKKIYVIEKNGIKLAVVFNELIENSVNFGYYGDSINPVELLEDVQIKEGLVINSFKISAPFTWTQKMFNDEIVKGTKPVINTFIVNLSVS